MARALAEQFDLRQRAATKFADPARMLLHRKGLEQATRLDVARWRGARVKHFAPKSAIVDATCGLGADALALIEAGLQVLALERDEWTASLAAHNLREMTGRNCVVLASAETAPVRADYWCIDPDRRGSGAQALDPRSWSPPLSVAMNLARAARGACIKLAPGIDLVRCPLPDAAVWPWHASWVSAGGELRECTLWCGEWAGDARPGEREVVALDRGASLREEPRSVAAWEPEEASALRWIAEP
ncbi:MAG: hypothetical protein ABIP42_12700, partial [Planctomycetota bacterium]